TTTTSSSSTTKSVSTVSAVSSTKSSSYATVTAAYESTSSNCDAQFQERLTLCASDLMRLGVFSHSSVNVDQLTLNDLSRQQREYFIELCSAYNKFNQCLGSPMPKQACYPIEPFKARFAVADAALDYVCGEGHSSMLVNWECYIKVAQDGRVAECEAQISQDTAMVQQSINEFSQGSSACSALQKYIECVREPIEETCDKGSFDTVVQALERPVHIYLPYCTLSSTSILPSFLLLLISWTFTSFLS
ncbi:unnamed protein product, partial [Enterobius vermicularis]|uniref:CG9896-like protein n=1 Tax=Enterobius vermicularis TaxID=51028 RepID=A0A0N4V611_ENTVE